MNTTPQLICLDVDGTLVGTSREVHPRVWERAQFLRSQGFQLAICTGRPALGRTRELAVQLDPQGWHIFQGGASLLNLSTNHADSLSLPAAALQTLQVQRREQGWVLELYSDDDFVCDQVDDGTQAARLARAHAELLELAFEPRPFESLKGTVVRAQWVVTDAQLPAVLATALPELNYASATSPSVPGVHFVSVTLAGVDKCSAIRRLAEDVIGCGLERTMMVGDGQNDISALQLVGYPVAMANADPALKAVARYEAGHVDEGGVAEALDLVLRLSQE